MNVTFWYINNVINRFETMISCFILQVIIATGVAYASSLDSAYNIEIVGHIPAG